MASCEDARLIITQPVWVQVLRLALVLGGVAALACMFVEVSKQAACVVDYNGRFPSPHTYSRRLNVEHLYAPAWTWASTNGSDGVAPGPI